MNYVVSKEYLCFDALLEMIVKDTNPSVPLSQVDFAEQFGITVPFDTATPVKNVKYSNDVLKCGTEICLEDINGFFKNNLISLKLSYIAANNFDEITFSDMVLKKHDKAYVVFAFCYGMLFNEFQNNDVGHVVLLETIDVNTDTVKIYDPGPRNHGSKIVKIDDMVYAMKRRGGIYLFEKVVL